MNDSPLRRVFASRASASADKSFFFIIHRPANFSLQAQKKSSQRKTKKPRRPKRKTHDLSLAKSSRLNKARGEREQITLIICCYMRFGALRCCSSSFIPFDCERFLLLCVRGMQFLNEKEKTYYSLPVFPRPIGSVALGHECGCRMGRTGWEGYVRADSPARYEEMSESCDFISASTPLRTFNFTTRNAKLPRVKPVFSEILCKNHKSPHQLPASCDSIAQRTLLLGEV